MNCMKWNCIVLVCVTLWTYMVIMILLTRLRLTPHSVRLCAGCCITQITGSLASFKSLILYTECICINMYIYIWFRWEWCYMVIYCRCILICLYRVTWICSDASGELIARMWSRWYADYEMLIWQCLCTWLN